MKKLGLLVFLTVLLGSVALVWAVTGKSAGGFSFFKIQIKGSGNVITEKRDLTGFKGVHAGSALQIEITVGKEFSVELEGDDNILPLIKSEVRNGILHFERTNRSTWTRGNVKVRISMPELNDLDISGASSATVTGVNSATLKLEASGASKVELSGTARELNAEASGASRVNADNLQTERATVDASGASKITVFASDTITAEASGASKIVYAGNPKSVTKNSSGASSVSAR